MNRTVRKVIVLNDFAAVNGGAAQIAINSLYGLAELVPEVDFFAAVGQPPGDLVKYGVRCSSLGQKEILKDPNRLRAAVQGLWNRSAALALKGLLEHSDPGRTVVHIHGWHKALSSSVVHTALRRGFKTVLTLHDYFAACPNGGFYNYPLERICPLKGMSPACIFTNCDVRNYGHKLYRVCRQFVQQRIGRLPNGLSHFIYYSDTALDHLKSYLPGSAALHRVDNPISIQQSPPVDIAGNRTFVFLGRVAREKGVRLFAEAVTRAGVAAVVIGSGPEEDGLKQAYPHIQWAGWQSPHSAMEMLKQARCLVFPSVWYETQGLVVREAAALGIPAIVSDATAAREWIDDTKNGLLFSSGHGGDLEDKIIRIRDDDALAASLGGAAHRKYWKHPATLENHAQSLVKIYETMLASPK